ncbi:hypothetical protein [Campylobacter gastrosuis]|uniref:Uncharacterized protein n=1 Tax=Campylobacter gastrosuis TaxID=2974576 RepID=A0ABT7HT37_9BACT|nr:hypothetical protein [Campylobacter gastrosuis]MDL0090082.1 hypothetical protein [Campylobacter gastrosuis]
MAKATIDNLDPELVEFIRLNELNKKTGKLIYQFATYRGFREAIKTAQRVAGVDENGVMSDEALKAINAVPEDDFVKGFELEIQGY